MTAKTNTQHGLSLSSKEMRAQRLKRLRKTTSLSRKDFSKKYKISPGTLQNWETARYGGLTEKGAKLMISALKCEQVFCTFEWLMYQSGNGPNFERIEHTLDKNTNTNQHSTPDDDLLVFQKSNNNTIHLIVNDDTMSPHFTANHIVAGLKKNSRHLSTFAGHICIVKITNSNTLLLRLIKPHQVLNDQCHLVHTNPLAESTTKLDQLYKIDYFAPIEWVRKL